MRVLGIETSTTSASVALVEGGKVVLERVHAQPKQSAERLLPLISELLAEAEWPRGSIARLGVSVGPGSFTGLRVGMACAEGLALGLGVPLVGVTSLRAMARAASGAVGRIRCPVLDARRAEVFVGAYLEGLEAVEVLAPRALPVATAAVEVARALGDAAELAWIGGGAALLGQAPAAPDHGAVEPSASAVGLLAEVLVPEQNPARPLYIRDAGATLPNLEPSLLR